MSRLLVGFLLIMGLLAGAPRVAQAQYYPRTGVRIAHPPGRYYRPAPRYYAPRRYYSAPRYYHSAPYRTYYGRSYYRPRPNYYYRQPVAPRRVIVIPHAH